MTQVSSIVLPAIASAKVPVRHRIAGLFVLVGLAALLGVAAWFDPSPGGLGTHEQLGLPPCGWILAMDVPCPTCGMTTAFSHAADGRLFESLRTQPLGGLLAIASAAAFLLTLHLVLTGSPLTIRLMGRFGRRSAWALCALLVISWVYKIIVYRAGI